MRTTGARSGCCCSTMKTRTSQVGVTLLLPQPFTCNCHTLHTPAAPHIIR